MRNRTVLSLIVVSLLAISCNGGTTITADGDIPGAEDTGSDVAEDMVPGTDTEPGFDTLAPDLVDPMDLAVDTEPLCEPGTGCFLDPCDENEDCLSGWCVTHLGSGVCTETCQEDCPAGWSCQQVAGTDPDLIFVCVSDFSTLCVPCASAADCGDVGGTQAACVIYGEETGSFCGGSCDVDGDCPQGFRCEEQPTVGGASLSQCIPEEGECACTPRSIELGLGTPCAMSNDEGTCGGHRVCLEEGLSACDAAAPVIELCDGVDNDCDDQVDEETCDDDNPCTEDACLGEAGCEHVALEGGECADGNPCTAADHCVAGVCVGDPVLCDDQNPCTDDACTETGGCDHVPNVADCDDGDPCTVADECGDGTCAGTPVACDCVVDEDCQVLEDGDLCNGTLVCDTTGLPFQCVVDPSTIIDCPAPEGADAPCLVPTCEADTGACGFAPGNPGGPCDDGDPCTVADLCAEGLCAAGVPANCNDGNPCTDDSCDAGVGCVHAPNALACEDGSVCTVGDSCQAGVCVSGAALACDDGDVCTDDACDPDSGCVHTPNALPCDDGNACTLGDTCAVGACTPGVAAVCDDGDVCTTDSCEPLIGCVAAANTAPCDDGDACTVGDACAGGTCAGVAVVCNDGNICTDDACVPDSGCTFTVNAAPCDDQNQCTAGDTCSNGTCAAGTAIPCNDGNLCTDDSCDPDLGCVFTDNAAPCDDGDVCTIGDLCDQGSCEPGGSLSCDDGNVCTDDSCDPVDGCLHGANTEPCNDGNTCTTGDVCAGGLCLGIGSLDCDDDNPCTKDVCQPGGGCENLLVDGACDDGDPCTLNDVCSGGACVSGALKTCDDGNVCTDDLCDMDGTCVHTVNTAPCDDGNQCTTGDACADGACGFADVVICDDGNLCTTDYCSPLAGCLTLDNTLPCDDLDACTTEDVCGGGACAGAGVLACDDSNPCTTDTCDPVAGCVFTNNNEGCDDGNECTTMDICEDGECNGYVAPDCDDLDVCTTDSCDPVLGCVHAHNTAPCDDGSMCTTVDVCQDGTCVGGVLLSCVDGDVCTSDSCDPDTGCVFPTIYPCCGNDVVEPPEECDDGNQTPGDGCDATCQDEPMDCMNGATQISLSPGANMMLCSNPSTCEQDYETLCPSGWLLCSQKQFTARNAGWGFTVGSKKALGAIRCRASGGAGHYTVDTSPLSVDESDNCWYGSSRPTCTADYGCNEQGNYALCCLMNSSCGNGVVDHPEEECDDGNTSNTDACLNNCMTRTGGGC